MENRLGIVRPGYAVRAGILVSNLCGHGSCREPLNPAQMKCHLERKGKRTSVYQSQQRCCLKIEMLPGGGRRLSRLGQRGRSGKEKRLATARERIGSGWRRTRDPGGAVTHPTADIGKDATLFELNDLEINPGGSQAGCQFVA